MRGTRMQLVLVTRKEVRALGLRFADKSMGERTVHGQKHVFARVGPSQLRALCEHSGRRKGVKVKVGGKSVCAFPPGANPKRSLSRAELEELRSRAELEELRNSIIQNQDDFKGSDTFPLPKARDSLVQARKRLGDSFKGARMEMLAEMPSSGKPEIRNSLFQTRDRLGMP